MSDLNDDLLTYDIGDVIDDQVLIGADEDELLLSDDDLDKDVTKEEKQKLKNEAEEWVKSQIAEGKKPPIKPQEETKQRIEKREQTHQPTATAEVKQTPLAVAKPVTNAPTKEQNSKPVKIVQDKSQLMNNEIIAPILAEPVIAKIAAIAAPPVGETATSTQLESLPEVEVPTSSTRDVDIEQYSTVSNSTSSVVPTDSCASSVIQSSQESASVTLSHGEISDPREDFEDEREERTNIKITSEREAFEHNNEHSPEKSMNRFMPHQKRNGAPLIRGHPMRGHPNPLFPRPPLRFSHHGQPFLQPQQPNINPFAPQHPSNALAPNAGHHGPMSNPQLDPNIPHQRPRHPFGFRPGPMGGFRHPNPANMFSQGPHDFQPNQGNTGFNHPYGGGPRNMFRPEGMPPGMRPGMRMQRPPLQGLPPHGMPGQGNFMNVPPMHIRPQVGPGPGPQQPGVATLLPTPQIPSTSNAAPTQQMPAAIPTSSSALAAPRKVLINPNFKGGVEAATSKFIQETQYMNAMNSGPHVSRVQSDEELLRQQEEFINKNREHIEKRRHARDASPPTRRSRSRSRSRSPRSRSRSVSRERSYTPPKRHANGGPNTQNANNRLGGGDRFERDRERDRERERERERDRDRDRPLNNNDGNNRMAARGGSRDREERDRERNRPLGGYNNRGGNRFRRGNSRDRDYENRSQGGGVGGQYGKRRRSKSPSPTNRGGGGGFGNNRGRYNNDRDKPEVDEDDETRAYRLQIEKQKALREQIMRDKEMKRRRAAEEKQYEDKRSGSGGGQQQQQQQKDESSQSQQQQPQKFKEIVPERKMISLKKRPAPPSGDNYADDHHSSSSTVSRKTIPTAKILPEAKKTLTEHLSNNAPLSSSSGRDHHQMHSGGHSNNTAVIKPVIKKDASVAAIRPQPQTSSHHAPARRLSSRCEDEVQLDYDEDDLLLDEEDLLASEPEPTPPRENISKQRAIESRTPSPEPMGKSLSRRPLQTRSSGGGSSKQSLSSHNRRIVLKTSSNSLASAMSSSDRNRGSSNLTSSGSSSSISRRVILDRLDVRNSRQQSPNAGGGGSGGGSSSSDSKRKPQRIILKHD